MELDNIIKNIECEKINYNNVEITGISYNSQTTQYGDLFICLVGENTDGHNYAQMAVEKGALALVVERKLDIDIPQIIVKSTVYTISDVSDAFYGSPSKDINLIGVTGTNGKTTVTHLIQHIFEKNEKRCALIGTLGYKLNSKDSYREAKHTTPQAPDLQRILHQIKYKDHIDNVAMEVSSHSLVQRRVGNCKFNGAVMTNLTQDHLDYHITMDNYFEAKSILFKNLENGSFAVLNSDDEYFERFKAVIPEGITVLTYGIKNKADVYATDVKFTTVCVKLW